MNYKEANELLQGRCQASRKMANNTYLQRREGGNIALLFHQTDVVTFTPDGLTILNSGGWQTMSTKERMNSVLPFGLYIIQEKGVWYVGKVWEDKSHPYKDGAIIGKRGGITGHAGCNEAKRIDKLKKSVKDYAHGFVQALKRGEVAQPSGGDCWGCYMAGKDGKAFLAKDHIAAHIQEKYYVPSLLVNAGKTFGISMAACDWIACCMNGEKVPAWLAGIAQEQTEKAIYKFVARSLGVAV